MNGIGVSWIEIQADHFARKALGCGGGSDGF